MQYVDKTITMIKKTIINIPLKKSKKTGLAKYIHVLQLLLLTLYMVPAHGSDKFKFEYIEGQLSYIKQLTLGQYANNEDKRIIKWVNDINIYIEGDMSAYWSDVLDSLIIEINHIIDTTQLKRVASEDQANYLIITGSAKKDYLNFHPNVPLNFGERFGNFLMLPNSDPERAIGGFLIYPNSDYEIIYGSMYIDFDMFGSNKYRRHILRQMLTQSLGIPYKSRKYSDSIFSNHPSGQVVIKYSNFDKTIIKSLYDECVKTGMDKFALDHVLINGC